MFGLKCCLIAHICTVGNFWKFHERDCQGLKTPGRLTPVTIKGYRRQVRGNKYHPRLTIILLEKNTLDATSLVMGVKSKSPFGEEWL